MWLTLCLLLFLFCYYGLLPPSKISQIRGSMCLSVHISPNGTHQVCLRTLLLQSALMTVTELAGFCRSPSVQLGSDSQYPSFIPRLLECFSGDTSRYTFLYIPKATTSPSDSISIVIEFPQGTLKQVGTASAGLSTTVRTSQLTWSYRGLCSLGHVL